MASVSASTLLTFLPKKRYEKKEKEKIKDSRSYDMSQGKRDFFLSCLVELFITKGSMVEARDDGMVCASYVIIMLYHLCALRRWPIMHTPQFSAVHSMFYEGHENSVVL